MSETSNSVRVTVLTSAAMLGALSAFAVTARGEVIGGGCENNVCSKDSGNCFYHATSGIDCWEIAGGCDDEMCN